MHKTKTDDLSSNALSIIFSNLAKASEKQQKYELQTAYSGLTDEYRESKNGADLASIKEDLAKTLAEDYPDVQAEAKALNDRGVQRALVWGQKVTTIQKSLIDRYLSKGEALTEGKDIYICEACGFIYLGIDIPALCPVCKAPPSRFSKI
ncbi:MULTISPECIES: rubredoxin-like domain-containing protein [unclassified Oceanispirochaeta]|uniref:rubredoxin-like domain-containing protein n=1 Tax=unclassified Oceanispirochaeta TaxID=2635722 RepID=UPI000E092FF7|nr:MULTISPECIES: hypothetical protein [unclassified Oceanispirochaeta]MBF9016268.1 hypothetical protein [Oceanispirochaeta sp. M2]NPD72730.1 hypothetical protein [Oceanispirochaeta sp. M1]RDG31577.1 hypothetical protein DV872_11530 [Oceanispirochaeta sp. M1]